MFSKKSDKTMMNIIRVCCNTNKRFSSKKVLVHAFDGSATFYFTHSTFIQIQYSFFPQLSCHSNFLSLLSNLCVLG